MRNNYIFINIRIPLYTHTKLFKIFPKPIIHDNVPYILNVQAEYMIEDVIGQNYFSNWNIHCFMANNRTFCKKQKLRNQCDTQYIAQSSKIFNKNCFSRLQRKNIITQVKNDVYFLIFDPIAINIFCNNSLTEIKIFQSSKIPKNKCSLNSTFFELNPNSTDYKMIFQNSTEIEWITFQTTNSKSMINLYCLAAFLILYLTTSAIFILLYCNLKTKISQSRTQDSPV